MAEKRVYSIPTIQRLPAYLRELRQLRAAGQVFVASPALARALRVDMITARKDMESIGMTGSPGIGFRVKTLIDGIESFLGWNNTSEAFLVGTTELGKALLGLPGFSSHGLKILAAFSLNQAEAGSEVHQIPVFSFNEFPHLARRLRIKLAILCVPDDEAQKCAEVMADAGILAIWNFCSPTLQLPDHVIRQKVNLAGDLAVLSVKLAEHLSQKESPLS